MTAKEYRERLAEVEAWANDKVNAYVFKGVKPIGNTPKVDEFLREAAIASGNRMKYAREIVQIEQTLAHLQECLDASWFDMDWPEAPSTPAKEAEAYWSKIWAR